MDSILDGLNPAQKTAVTSPASVVQILAPPGSGKTKTLTSRVAYLLSHFHYQPRNILCLTFTIKSSREMKERIAKLIGNGMEAKLILGTFHSVCRRYLVSYGHLIGLRKSFGIADSSDSIAIVTRIIKRLNLNIDPKAARSRISGSKARGISFANIAMETKKKKRVDQEEFVKVFEAYESHLAISYLLDYDDLLLRCVDLLQQHPDCVSNVEVVLIDEFQDTNLVQFDLMRLFAAKAQRVTTVGDPDQSIYGWRSAEIKNLKRMQKQYPDTLIIHLEDNYRSSGAILLAALEVIQQDESRPPKPLLPTHCPGTVPVLRKLPTAAIEAAWIVSEIQRCIAMTGYLLTFSDFAILLRSASLSRQIESAMGKIGIPYRMVGGLRFFDRLEIKILLDYLRVISQPDNSDALARIINIPSRRIGDPTIKSLLEEAETKRITLWNLIRESTHGHLTLKTKISKVAEQGLGSLINIILTARLKMLDHSKPQSPRNTLEYVIKKLDFQKYIEQKYPDDHEARWANVEELLAQASDSDIGDVEILDEENNQNEVLPKIEGVEQQLAHKAEEALSNFLAIVALSTELQRDEDTDENTPFQERATLSTIHAAKGLEWPVIFIPSTYEGSIPHSRAEDTDEERRLLYVAMTRAQALLYMSCPTNNSMREETTLSSFLSTKKVSSYLVNKGPQFRLDVVQDISRILRRDCPTEQTIAEAISTVESIEDDLWPVNGEVNPEVVEARWDNFDGTKTISAEHHASKRRKTSATRIKCFGATSLTIANANCGVKTCPAVANTTMQNRNDFTIVSYTSGFVSATSQLQHITQKESFEDKKTTLAQTNSTTKDEIAVAKSKITSRGQISLMTSWATNGDDVQRYHTKTKAASVSAGLDSTHFVAKGAIRIQEKEPSTTAFTTVRSTARSDTLISQARKPMVTIPQALAEHKITTHTNTKHLRTSDPNLHSSKPYVFLSSSPPPVEELLEEAETSTNQNTSNTNIERVDSCGSEVAMRSSSNMRPATSFHITSIAQMNGANIGPRKTLGVRRTMAGWSARGKRGVAPPIKARDHDAYASSEQQ